MNPIKKYPLFLLGLCILLSGCNSQKNPDRPLPLVEAVELPEEQIENALSGFTRDELVAAWGEPSMELFGMDGEVYPFDSEDHKGHLTVYYGTEDRSVVSVKLTEESEEETAPLPVMDLDQLVAEGILSDNQGKYPGEELRGEGHIILESRENGDELIVYALTMYGEYQFQDGNFVKEAGTGVIPAVITFLSDPKGGYEFQSLSYPEDGSHYTQSIQTMFPEKWWDRCISPSEADHKQLKVMEESYATNYLKELGRTATVGEYKDFEHPLLTDQGVSIPVSNLLVENKALGSYPFWIGSIERMEDGIRYVYALDFDRDNEKILFTKTEYDTGNVIESYTYDSDTGLLLPPEDLSHESSWENRILKEPPALMLQDALSSTLNKFELKPDTASWNYRQEEDGDSMVGFVSCGAHPLAAAVKKERLKLPRYNRMDFVSYLVSSDVLPDRILVNEYELPDTLSQEETFEGFTPVSSETYEDGMLINLKPGMGYEITAEWDKEQLESRGFYGTGYYSLITE